MSTDAVVRPTPERLPLRERKKLRTRQALVETALDLFTRRGFDGVTLDELCDAVDVSKRTFFRTFAGKEDVAMAPTQDLWAAFLDDLETRELDERPVLQLVEDALLAALASMTADSWTHEVRLSLQLATETPSMDAHGRAFCDRTTRTALATLHRRLAIDDPKDLRPRLTLDVLVAAFHCALDVWAASSKAGSRTALATHFREAVAALPSSLTLTVAPRPTENSLPCWRNAADR